MDKQTTLQHYPNPQSLLYVAQTADKGLGVFASVDIVAGQVLEVAPVLFFDKDDQALIDKTQLYNYYFSTSFLPQPDAKKAGCLVMGTLSFCNHADSPNAVLEKIAGDSLTLFKLVARQDIPRHTEILITYGMVWFPAV